MKHATTRSAQAPHTMEVGWGEPTQFTVPIPRNEKRRLRRLADFSVLDTPAEESFDQLARLAAQLCHAPIAMISLVDADRQWFKAKVGVDFQETPRATAFCAHAIMSHDLFVVNDATMDARFAQNPLVTEPPGIRFYAGAPLVTNEDCALGTLCVIDRVPRQLTEEQRLALRTLSRVVMTQLELRRNVMKLRDQTARQRADVKTLQNALARATAGEASKSTARKLKPRAGGRASRKTGRK